MCAILAAFRRFASHDYINFFSSGEVLQDVLWTCRKDETEWENHEKFKKMPKSALNKPTLQLLPNNKEVHGFCDCTHTHTLYFCISRDRFAYFTIWSNTNSSSNSSNSCNKPKVHMLSRSVQFQVLCIYVRLLDTDFKVFITHFSGKCNIKEIDFDWPDSYDTHTWSIVINRSFVQSPNASPTTLDKYCGEKEAAARKY